jgi:hypothetical protein
MTLTDGADTHDETSLARCRPFLVGVHHHAWVAECGTLDGIFTRKGGTQEEPAGGGQPVLRGEPVRELVRMLKEYFGQAVMSSIESLQYVIKTLLHFFVRQFQDSL